MNESLLAGRYAKALLAYAQEVGEADRLYPILRTLGRSLRPGDGVGALVDNPTLSESLRKEVVMSQLGGERVPESLRRFLDLVFSHDRERLIGEMARSYVGLYRKACGITYVRLTSAEKLDEGLVERIRDYVARLKGGRVEMEQEVRKELIGGFIIRVDGKVLDGSMSGELERIRREFIGRNRAIL